MVLRRIAWPLLLSFRSVWTIRVDEEAEPEDAKSGPAEPGSSPDKQSMCRCQMELPTVYRPTRAQAFDPASKLPACAMADVPGKLPGNQLKLDDCWVEDFCQESIIDKIRSCFKRLDRKPHFYFLGDSISKSALPGIQKGAEAAGFSFRRWQGIACTLRRSRCECPAELCNKAFSTIQDTLAKDLAPGDVVAVQLHRTKFETWCNKSHEAKMKHLEEDLVEMAQVAARAKATLLLIGDVLVLPQPGSLCKQDPQACKKCEFPESGCSQDFRDLQNLEQRLAREHGNVKFFDAQRLLCTGGMCGAMIPGTHTVGTYDCNHLAAEGAYYFWPFLCDLLVQTSGPR
eukprot:TRINITY_DN92546_c0_g1_i1.p1 TRINITY_DN92546_c0_g1~~TRINITY_DN92546_c0_g1_i1.p1  ORF type:complete len:343 (-),score=60.44 TRINITY_DN92546_c0_g1_i1:75-1103(-)